MSQAFEQWIGHAINRIAIVEWLSIGVFLGTPVIINWIRKRKKHSHVKQLFRSPTQIRR